MQDGISMGKEDATNRVHLNKHLYLLHTYTGNNKHACSKAMKTRMHLFYEGCGTGQRHEQGEALRPTTINDVQALKQFYLPGLGATTFIQINRKDHPQRQGSQTGPLGSLWHGTWETEWVPRDRAGYLHPRGASMGRVATSRPHGS